MVIYGANASGKTTLLDVLSFASHFVLGSASLKPGQPIDVIPYLLDPYYASSETEFEITFFQEEVRYQYGFSLTGERIRNEYLYAAPHGRTVPYYQRQWGADENKYEYYFGPSLKGQNEQIKSLTKDNALFLSVAATFNHPVLSTVYRWFEKMEYIVLNGWGNAILDDVNENYHNQVKNLLRYADLGIIDYQVKARPEDDKLHFAGERLEFFHDTASGIVKFPLQLESNGIRKFLYLCNSVLPVLNQGGILSVDEINTSLHPLLVRAMVELFHNPTLNCKNAQLIFNTHDTTLLDQSLFRRDQVWFTEKDQNGAAHLYSLMEYSPRKGESLAKGYLQGRYGAIPFLGDPSLIFAEEDVCV